MSRRVDVAMGAFVLVTWAVTVMSSFGSSYVKSRNIKNQQKINERELQLGLTGHEKSWHSKYKNSAWIYFGGVNFDLTEGDLLCVFSQYGEIVNINLVRDKKTGKSRGFGFICYEDQRSTILSVDNLNGIKLCNRIIRVDHVENYRPPKDSEWHDELTKLLHEKGCAPEVVPGLVKDETPGSRGDEVDSSRSATEAQDKLDKAERRRLRKEKKRAKKARKKEKKALKKAKKDKKRAKKAADRDSEEQDREQGNGKPTRSRRNPTKAESDKGHSSNDEDASSSSSSSDSEEPTPAKRKKIDGTEKIPSVHSHSRSEYYPASPLKTGSGRHRDSDSKNDQPRVSHRDRKRSPVARRRSRTPDRYRRRSRSR